MINYLPSFWWVVRMLVLGIATRWVLCQDDFGVCDKYFNFPSANDVSVLAGKWLTVGSTRRVFPCNKVIGNKISSEVMELEESWMIPGIMGVWKHSVTSEIISQGNHLEVTMSELDGVLTPGKLAIGEYENGLILVQCTYFPWSPLFPLTAITILSRDVPSDPPSEAQEIFERFNVSSSIPSFSIVKHDGCETLRTTNLRTGAAASSQLLTSNGATELDIMQRSPGWRIRGSPDTNIIF